MKKHVEFLNRHNTAVQNSIIEANQCSSLFCAVLYSIAMTGNAILYAIAMIWAVIDVMKTNFRCGFYFINL